MKTIKEEWKKVWVPEIRQAIQEFKNSKTRYRQIPNLLTASRLFSPVIIIPVALTTNVFTTFIVASLFALTDMFDGKIARKYHIQSKLGAMLDPVTDKLFALGLLLPNLALFPIITSSIMVLETVIGFINTRSTLKGNKPNSNMLGKTKTTFVSITAIAMYLTNIPLIKFILPFLSGITILLETSAAITYQVIDSKKDLLKKQEDIQVENIKMTTSKKMGTDVKMQISRTDLKQKLLLEKEKLVSTTNIEKPNIKKK